MGPPLLLHSVSFAGLWGQQFLSLDDFTGKAAELGFDGVMLMAKSPHLSVVTDAAERARLRALLDRHKLQSLVVAGYCNLTGDLEHGEIPYREINVVYLTELARLTHDMGGSLLRVFTGYDHPLSGLPQQWNLIVATLREAAMRAAEFGVTLGVQNHHDIACDWRNMQDLLRQVDQPNCRAMFDAWAPALQGGGLRESAREMATLSVHTTVADYQLRPRFRYAPDLVNYETLTPSTMAVPMGEGMIDYPGFFAGLREGGFQGSVAYEMCSPLRDGGNLATLEGYARHFISYMKGLA